MRNFEISVGKLQRADAGDLRRIRIAAGDVVLTRLIRPGREDEDHCLEAPPDQLAFWLIDNWWRIRWEPAPPDRFHPEWRLAHDLSSIGGGYIWPRVSIWGEGSKLGVASRADSQTQSQSVRFLANGLYYVSASSMTDSVDAFIGLLLDGGTTADRKSLRTEHRQLLAERNDPEIADWRKLEAMLGFDPDEAPNQLIEGLGALMDRYGHEGVEEAAIAHQGHGAAATLQSELEAAQDSKVRVTPPPEVQLVHVEPDSETTPWQQAEGAAAELRARLAHDQGPIRNHALSEVLCLPSDQLKSKATAVPLDYGLRLRDTDGAGSRVAVRAKWSHSRRYELCRTLADIIWSDNDGLGPLSSAKSSRQKFQRTFAQSFLCPFDDLVAYMDTEQPEDDDVQAAARHFHVPVRVIQTLLVNKGVIGRASFEEMIEAA